MAIEKNIYKILCMLYNFQQAIGYNWASQRQQVECKNIDKTDDTSENTVHRNITPKHRTGKKQTDEKQCTDHTDENNCTGQALQRKKTVKTVHCCTIQSSTSSQHTRGPKKHKLHGTQWTKYKEQSDSNKTNETVPCLNNRSNYRKYSLNAVACRT